MSSPNVNPETKSARKSERDYPGMVRKGKAARGLPTPLSLASPDRPLHRRISHPPRRNPRLHKLAPGLTLGELARRLGVNTEYVSRIFNRKRQPSAELAMRMANTLGISFEEFTRVVVGRFRPHRSRSKSL